MRFALTPEQESFAASLEALLSSSGTVAVARAWAVDDTGPGLALWKRLADQGVAALVVPEDRGGLGASPVELVVAFEALGRHAVPGPWVESAAYLPGVLTGAALEQLAGGAVGTVAVPPHVPYALDADVADQVYVAQAGALTSAEAVDRVRSVDGTRRLFTIRPTGSMVGRPVAAGTDKGFDLAALATAAQLLGAGERLLVESVAHARQRKQFGREIGSYQAVKHQLADVRIALDFARPLVFGAALTAATPEGSRDASVAKVAAGDAAYLASRTALQVHGAVGYTRELDLSLWITKVRALVGAWGTPAHHRSRVLAALTAGDRPA